MKNFPRCARPYVNDFLKKIELIYEKIFRAARAHMLTIDGGCKNKGGDASENGDFQRGKQRLQGYKIFEYHKMALLFR